MKKAFDRKTNQILYDIYSVENLISFSIVEY